MQDEIEETSRSTKSRAVLSGIVVFWLVRLVLQFAVYDSAIWRGKPFYTAMHVVFSAFWVYVVVVYAEALGSVWQL